MKRTQARRRCNVAEATVIENLEKEGYEVLVGGWPDILAVRGNDIRFIEVKLKGQRLRWVQFRVADTLKRLGIKVEVLHVDIPPGQRVVPRKVLRRAS